MADDRAPVQDVNAHGGEAEDDEEMPKMGITRERAVLFGLFVVSAIAFLYFVLPQLSDVKDTWGKLDQGDPIWLAVAFGLQLAATASYIAVFQGVHVPPGYPIRFRESYQITMAGLAATRLFAAGGAGGVALTAWALRRSGMPRREVAERMIAFLVLTYAVYMLALIVCGFGLRWGIFPGSAPYGVTMIPAYIALIAIAIFLAITFLPADLSRRLSAWRPKTSRLGRVLRFLASGPERLGGGTRFALHLVRHPDWALMGTLGWWGFNVGVLWASCKAFGHAPPIAVVIQAYFVGLLANLLPLPGGIGGVDGGMIGALIAFDVDPGVAVVAVLVYRGFAFWLPTLPGAIAYLQLRRTVARWRQERLARGADATASVTA
jgi:putative heme transporter